MKTTVTALLLRLLCALSVPLHELGRALGRRPVCRGHDSDGRQILRLLRQIEEGSHAL